jgi:hypothetical protein
MNLIDGKMWIIVIGIFTAFFLISLVYFFLVEINNDEYGWCLVGDSELSRKCIDDKKTVTSFSG